MPTTGTGLPTHFASPERYSEDVVHADSVEVKKKLMLSCFDAVPMGMAIINKHRQIIYCNEAFRQLAHKQQREDVIGLRPGEALDCVNSTKVEAGCGCSEFCDVCGAAQAIIKSLDGIADCQDCRMTRLVHGVEEPLDLQVFTTPMKLNDEPLTTLFVMDISHELKLRYFNRTFYHGLINGVGGIATLTELIEAEPDDSGLFSLLIESSRRTLKDILYHRDVTAAEEGRLTTDMETFKAEQFINSIISKECTLRNTQSSCIDINVTAEFITTDKRLLSHVISNMLSNAIEARESAPGQVTLECKQMADGRIRLGMTNPGDIPPIIRKQMFKRYISTKSRERGLGNYVIKLFTEKYLDGKVDFITGDGTTTFFITLPVPEK
nr:ATP-binding protein [uncultured Pseudodesulfovibrio sp.]